MTKRKTTATGLAKTSGQGGKLPGALPAGYTTLLADLKARVRAAQLRAVVSVNRELILLYWDIGRIIAEAQKTKGYGKQVVERLAEDLQKEFPGTAGFSPQNVWFMRSFYLAWPAMPEKPSQVVRESKTTILSQPVRESATSAPPAPISELPWGHNRLLLTKLDTPAIRLWYAHKAIEHGWSRAVLTHHIETQLHKREGKAVTNFQRTLARRSPISPNKRSKTHTISISSRSAVTRMSATSNRVCSTTSRNFCSNSASASRLLAGNITWKSAARIITSTCCFITCGCAATS
jgi:predicted nuclease of restriction endonuclease-like (RecB) superfamily